MDVDLNEIIDVRRLIEAMAYVGDYGMDESEIEELFIDACREYFEDKNSSKKDFDTVDLKHFIRHMTYQGLGCIDRCGSYSDIFKGVDAEEWFNSTLTEEPWVQKLVAELSGENDWEMNLDYVFRQIAELNPWVEEQEEGMMKEHIKLLYVGWAWFGNRKMLWIFDGEDYVDI